MRISNFKSRKEWSLVIWQKILRDMKNPALSAALDSLLSPYEKSIIVNRFAAVSLIKEGKTYRQIGKELWLSPTTIRSLKRTLENNPVKEYQSYRLLKNGRQNKVEGKSEVIETPSFINWVDYCLSVRPKKIGPRWKFK